MKDVKRKSICCDQVIISGLRRAGVYIRLNTGLCRGVSTGDTVKLIVSTVGAVVILMFSLVRQ